MLMDFALLNDIVHILSIPFYNFCFFSFTSEIFTLNKQKEENQSLNSIIFCLSAFYSSLTFTVQNFIIIYIIRLCF